MIFLALKSPDPFCCTTIKENFYKISKKCVNNFQQCAQRAKSEKNEFALIENTSHTYQNQRVAYYFSLCVSLTALFVFLCLLPLPSITLFLSSQFFFMVRRGAVCSASACCKAGPSSILGTTGRVFPLSFQAMRRWREAPANGDG